MKAIRIAAVNCIMGLTNLLEQVCKDDEAAAYLARYNAILDGEAA